MWLTELKSMARKESTVGGHSTAMPGPGEFMGAEVGSVPGL